MKKTYVLGMAVLVAALLAMSGVAQSAMWVGAQIGGNFPLDTNITATSGADTATASGVHIQPSVIGGVIIGYDFVNSGFGAYAWPRWMQYFSFAMDITYNLLEIRGGQTVGARLNGVNLGDVTTPDGILKGYELAWTFLFMAHYGFLRDSEVPTGRINPYIGVGPAILWSGFGNPFAGRSGADAMNVALVVEPGIRWMVLKNVSIDTAMRYRYAQPSWTFVNTTLKPDSLHQLAFLVRANLHF